MPSAENFRAQAEPWLMHKNSPYAELGIMAIGPVTE
jgi:hypothetical protein